MRVQTIKLLLSVSCSCLLLSAPGSTSASGESLKGTVNDSDQMKPSVTLTVPSPAQNQARQQLDVKQYAGSMPYSAGQPAPVLPKPVPNIVHQGQVNGSGNLPSFRFMKPPPPIFRPFSMPPPPRWNYTLTPRNGIMTWTPGYDVKVVTAQRTPVRVTNLSAHGTLTSSQLSGARFGAQALQPYHQPQPQLKAVQMTLSTKQARAANWNDWYKQVAQSVYEIWRQEDTGAGCATVRVKVYPSQNIDCQVTSFSPAGDLKRDAARESLFRTTAVRSVNALDGSSVWEFPPILPLPHSVVFDLEMKHEVGSAAGCRVVGSHNS